MKRQDKALRIQQILDEHFPSPAIPLRHEDPFTLLVAVLLSAQCADVRVNAVTPALFARARTAAAMCRLSVATIRSLIRPCGLSPQKSKAIRALSQQLVKTHGGDVPRDLTALEQLPGVGHKTASVVMAQAFGIPTFPVDTHIHRLAWRWGLTSGRSVEQTERDLVRTFPRARWNTLHLQLIWFGRTSCTAVKHVPAGCPICSWAMSKARRADERRRRARPQPKSDRISAHGSRVVPESPAAPAAVAVRTAARGRYAVGHGPSADHDCRTAAVAARTELPP